MCKVPNVKSHLARGVLLVFQPGFREGKDDLQISGKATIFVMPGSPSTIKWNCKTEDKWERYV